MMMQSNYSPDFVELNGWTAVISCGVFVIIRSTPTVSVVKQITQVTFYEYKASTHFK